MNTTRFDACWPLVLAEECPCPKDWSNPRNFSNDPEDPGGATMCGIIQTEYNYYRAKHGMASQSVRLITRDEGRDIGLNSYWLPHCPALAPGLDLQFFDECFNTGPVEATKVLQVALGIQADGVWGPMTMMAVGELKPFALAPVVKAYTARRIAVYSQMRGFGRFGKGWDARAARIGAAALKMVPTNGGARAS